VLLGVTLEVDFSALRNETRATLLTTTANTIAASFSSHTCAEAVLTLANTLRWLVSSFAHGDVPVGILKSFHPATQKLLDERAT
jgi:hypothetical protein